MRLLILLVLLMSVVSADYADRQKELRGREEFENNKKLFHGALRNYVVGKSSQKCLSCDRCKQLVGYLQRRANSQEDFVETLLQICSMNPEHYLKASATPPSTSTAAPRCHTNADLRGGGRSQSWEDLCKETVYHYGAMIGHILRNMDPVDRSDGARMLCNTWIGVCPELKPRLIVPLEYDRDEKPAVRPKASGKKPFKFVHFSNLHIDPYYGAGQSSICPFPMVCCRALSEKSSRKVWRPRIKPNVDPWYDWEVFNAGPFGFRAACDTPDALQQSMYKAMGEFSRDAEFAIFTGGIMSRQVWNGSVKTNTQQIESAYRNMSTLFDYIYPAVGGVDSSPAWMFPGDDVIPELGQQWLYALLGSISSDWIGVQEAKTMKTAGYYSTKVPHRNLRLISLNTNLYSNRNLWVYQDPIDPDPGGQMAWLIEELEAASRAKQHVYIIGHMPMGDPEILPHYSQSLNVIIRRYSSAIAAMFFGHTYYDEFQLHYWDNPDTTANDTQWPTALVTSYMVPSLAPVHGTPSYREFYVDPETYAVMDIVTYTSNMNDNYWETDKAVYWMRAYSARAAYGIPQDLGPGEELSPEFWHKVSERFQWDNQFYRYYYGRKTAWAERKTGESQRAKDLCFIRGGLFKKCSAVAGEGGEGEQWGGVGDYGA